MIINLIRRNQLKKAIDKILELCKSINKLEDTTTVLSARLSEVSKEDMQGALSFENENIEKNKIRSSLQKSYRLAEKELIKIFPNLVYEIHSEPLRDQVNMKLDGRYILDSKLSFSGGTAFFIVAEQALTGRRVMLRILKESQAFDDKQVDEKKETQEEEDNKSLDRIFKIKHRNIIKVIDGDLRELPRYLVLEYINGISLDHMIGKVPFTQKRALSIFKQLCQAIYYLHINKIVHKNIKPDKVLIDEELIPVISAFDIASSVKDGGSWSIGKLLYAAPELIQDVDKKPDYFCDQFSLGLIGFELFAGFPLFADHLYEEGETKNAALIFENRQDFFRVKVRRKERIDKMKAPKGVKDIITKMLSEDPKQRYASLGDVLSLLEEISIKKNKDQEIALASYERCCIARPDFTRIFYNKLVTEGEKALEFAAYFPNDKEIKLEDEDNQRHKMLRTAIDLLIHCQTSPDKFKQVVSGPIHSKAKIAPQLYPLFIDTVIKTVKETDPLWPQEEETNKIALAWNNIKTESFKYLPKK